MLLMMRENIARNMQSSQGTINYSTQLHLVGHFVKIVFRVLYGQYHQNVLTSERILIFIVKFDYELQNLQHKFYISGLVEVRVLSGAEKLIVAQSVKIFPGAFEPQCQLPYLSEAATLRFLQTRLFYIHTSHLLHIHLNVIPSSILRCLKRFIPFRDSD